MIKLININKYYQSGSERFHALKDVNLDFGDTGMNFIVGKSGSGKSTLLNIIGGIDKYDSGDLIIDDVSTKDFHSRDFHSYRNSYIGFVFQEFNVLKGLNVYDNIAISLDLQKKDIRKHHHEIQAIIDRVGLTGLEKRKMNQISGGEKQRVAIARALIKKPRVIIADEPTGNLDSKNSRNVMDLLKELSKEHLILIVTHNRKLSDEYSERTIEIKDGTISNDTGKTEISDNKLELQQIKTPIKTSFNLAVKTVIQYKIRFIFMIILFALSLTFAGIVVNLYLVDTTLEFANYQSEYNNNFIFAHKDYYHYGLSVDSAFFGFEYANYLEEYHNPDAKMFMIRGNDYNIPINKNAVDENAYYATTIQRIHLYDSNKIGSFIYGGTSTTIIENKDEDGNITSKSYPIYITDYLAENLIWQNYFNDSLLHASDLINKVISYPELFNNSLIIKGIIKTDYANFDQLKNPKNQSDSRTMVAFTDSLVFYNSIFASATIYQAIASKDNMPFNYNNIIYSVVDRLGTYEDVIFTNYLEKTPGAKTVGRAPLKPEPGFSPEMALSTGFMEKVLGLKGTIDEMYAFTNFSITVQASEYNDDLEEIDVQIPFYLNAYGRIPVAISFIVTSIIEDDRPIAYFSNDTASYDSYLDITYLGTNYQNENIQTSIDDYGGFITMIINDDSQINGKIYRSMLNSSIIIDNQAFKKVLLVEDFISSNLWLFIGLFFVFGLFSVLFIFNFIIINIKNSTRDIGIFMSLGFSGFKIALIYFFQVMIMGLSAFILATISTWLTLLILDINFTALALVDLKIIKMTFFGILTIFGIATLVPSLAIITPLINLSRKHPIDVIKTN